MSGRLFISHANEDEAVTSRIVAYLEQHGAPCWISSRDIAPRAIYADAIAEAMHTCSACVVILSATSNASKAVKRELELASHYDKPFIPIRIDATEPEEGLNYYLRNTQWVDYGRDGERALDRIVSGEAAPTATPSPTQPAKAQTSDPSWRTYAIMIGVLVLLIGAGLFFLMRGEQMRAATNLAPLLGSYHWDGVACGAGPVVTTEQGDLIFTMAGTATYRHRITLAQADHFETIVVAPDSERGKTYSLTPEGDTLRVSTEGREDIWQRCETP